MEEAQTVDPFEPFSSRRALPVGGVAIPAAKLAVAGDEALPNREDLPRIFRRDGDLCQSSSKLGGGLHMIGERFGVSG